jgi:drug/metabolite transporter (DMT)-like permease
MTAQIIGLLTLFSLMLASGQTVFKMAARTAESLSSVSGFMSLASNAWFWLALALYGGATLLWIYILQKINLVQAYPFVALGFIIVPIAAYFFLGERVNIMYYAGGIALILAGLWLITVKAGV